MLRLVVLLLPLCLDTFAVSAAVGVSGLSRQRMLRVSLLFALFEGAMPLVGLAIGAPLGRAVGSGADYLAIAVLIGFGLYVLLGDDDDEGQRIAGLLNARGAGALLLGLSVSLDELAIGFTLGLLRLPTIPAVIFIAAQAFVISQLGLRLGSRVSERAREGAERLAGIALTALGVVLLAEKLLA